MQGIFISYRRQDSQSAAGRLADHVKEQLPGVSLFRDVETIEPGVDFTEAIGRALQSCGVLLAVIGPHWTSVADAAGKRRLDNAHDYTRLEIVTALQRSNVRVIPVLVEGAQMPDADDLPEDLQPLCRRNAIELTDKRWSYDVSQLIETLRKTLGIEPPTPRPEPPPAPEPVPAPVPQAWYQRLSKKQWGIIAAVVVVLGILGQQQENGMIATQPPPMLSDPTVPPAPAVSGSQASAYQVPTALPNLSGAWQDVNGGSYRFFQQGGAVKFDGQSVYGPVYGEGAITGNSVMLNYAVNGAAGYVAQLELSADRARLSGGWRNTVTGEGGTAMMQRLQ